MTPSSTPTRRMPSSPPIASRRGRGRVAEHDIETLLDLVAAVARAVVAAGGALTRLQVTMAAFNRARAEVDRARGIADPQHDRARTPTAEAITMRLGKLAAQPVPWQDILDGATRTGRNRTMWLSALLREDTVDDLTDAIVNHALRLVAHKLKAATVSMRVYTQKREQLVAEDRAFNGDDGVLETVLPTANQILAHCGMRWQNALKLAGVETVARPRSTNQPLPPFQRAGMPVAQVVAFYGALNRTWPSKPLLWQFAASSNLRMTDPSGPMGPQREQAAELLRAEGVEPPTRTRGGGKGRRATYRYPASGIPGAPPRQAPVAAPRFRLTTTSMRGFSPQMRAQYAVLSLRVWLAGLTVDDRRTRAKYVSWQVGTHWMQANAFNQELGGFSALKEQAARENEAARRSGLDALEDAHALADEMRAVMAHERASRAEELDGPPDPEPVPFGEALDAVLAGECIEVVAEAQAK